MASLLRAIVSSPRNRHSESDLDLCYITDHLIATSGPGASYPQHLYRNPLKDLVKFLDSKHRDHWAIWEFRAEGTGYEDDEVYGRIRHYPWPDHHPPPFALVPLIMASMRNWLTEKGGRVAVVHCKAGKGRSGTVACSYLISEEGWSPEDAMQRFTDRRMKPGFGVGISIPSQRRTISYVERWTKHGKIYVERPVEILEIHIWGLRNGVKIAVEGYVDEGKTIKTFHTFGGSEREIVRGAISKETGFGDVALEVMGKNKKTSPTDTPSSVDGADGKNGLDRVGSDALVEGGDVVFRPSTRVVLPSNDINIDFERRNKSKYGGFTMVSSVAHVWFNTFFEGRGPEQNGRADESGVFEIDFDAMDGIKGSSRKGTRAFDRMAVLWKAVELQPKAGDVIVEPAEGEEVPQMKASDEKPVDSKSHHLEKKLGLRAPDDASAGNSRASSVVEVSPSHSQHHVPDEIEGVKAYHPEDGSGSQTTDATVKNGSAASYGDHPSLGMSGVVSGIQGLSTADLPGGVPESQMRDIHHSAVGSLHKSTKE
ncbi:Telomerase protein component 1 [Elasticomyces elasticus]|nr:Telomerase protein component 1 [Elasticomyces elasticus]KAK3618597.1 Telomerase protein component 1 [Elasticomyces elasticus]KAK4908943.1 Telomerase protein component 1 [Elasticomyces elasticus]KAK5744460.1 Telomerase protein component 1 [Elasticomyces elasticus]